MNQSGQVHSESAQDIHEDQSMSYKAIHYERQTQLKLDHVFDVALLTQGYHWLTQISRPFKPGDVFTWYFECTLPDRRKIKRDSLVFDMRCAKEYETAQAGIMYARALIDIFVSEHFVYKGCAFSGLIVGPSQKKEVTKTCLVLPVEVVRGIEKEKNTKRKKGRERENNKKNNSFNNKNIFDALLFAVKVIFSQEDIHYMQKISATLYFNGIYLNSLELPYKTGFNTHLEGAFQYYSNIHIQNSIYKTVKNRNILYAFNENPLRQGMMVYTDTGWDKVGIHTPEDIETAAKDYKVTEFIPAVNRILDEYPSIITIETDPGDLFTTVLGVHKAWIFNTYITQKIMDVLSGYNIVYSVKFSGNKGWHIQIPIELEEPFFTYQKVVKAIVNKDIDILPDETQTKAKIANLEQLQDVKSYKDPFFVARRFVDLVGAHIMFYELKDIHTVLDLPDIKHLLLKVSPVCREDFLRKYTDIYDSHKGPVKAEIPQVLSINPYSKFRRQFKLLIDHSSNKKEGKLRSVFSLHSKTGLVSIPAVVTNNGTKLGEFMWDVEYVRKKAHPDAVINGFETGEYYEGCTHCEVNDSSGFEKFLHDHTGLLIYLLQNGGEALELLDTPTAVWVNTNLWEKTVGKG
ncbi:MAG: hypothetical protein PVF58_12400 [Candidatus Methanofastidiosia archaeon]